MKKLLTFFAILTLFLAESVSAQITLTSKDYANFYAEGNTYTTYFDMTTTSIDIGQPGGGNEWDFSNFISSSSTIAVMVAPSSTPKGSKYSDANYATFVKDNAGDDYGTYSYFHLGNNFESCGSYSKLEIIAGTVTETESHCSPFEISTKLPLTAGVTWTQSYKVEVTSTTPSMPPIAETDDVTVTRTVDAWGTMTVPGKTKPIEALRVRLDEKRVMHTAGGDSYIRWISYEFVTKYFTTVGFSLSDTTSPDKGVVSIIGGGWGVSSLTGVRNNNSVVNNFRLEQNYPNPFNPTTTIKYSIPDAAVGIPQMRDELSVRLTVYDILGREVATLVNKAQAPGNYSVVFDASGFSSGIYFYTLHVGNFVQTKKCVLIK